MGKLNDSIKGIYFTPEQKKNLAQEKTHLWVRGVNKAEGNFGPQWNVEIVVCGELVQEGIISFGLNDRAIASLREMINDPEGYGPVILITYPTRFGRDGYSLRDADE